MGQAQCWGQEHITEYDHLEQLDAFLLEQIEQLRKNNQPDISIAHQIKYPDQSIFKGIINKSNKKCKYGEFYSKGHAYFGSFEDDLPHGFGIIVKNQCEYHRGNFERGKFHGIGKQSSADHFFEGQYENGCRKKGILKTSEIQYQGEFKKDKFDGEGRILFANGDGYDGHFENGKFSGQGLLTFANENTYEGGFKEGKYHGQGKFTWANGKCNVGIYENGKLVTRELKTPMKIRMEIKNEHDIDPRKINYKLTRPVITRGNGMLNLF